MKRYYKIESGTRKWFNGILRVGGMQVINPSEEQILAAGYVEYVPPKPPAPTEGELLQKAKDEQIRKLHEYDRSNAVNTCYIRFGGQTIRYWADKFDRDALRSTVVYHQALGHTDFRLDLRDAGLSITVGCELLLQMLASLEVYATACYHRTTDHEFAIRAMTSVQEVYAYNFYGAGYPDKPVFDLDGSSGQEGDKEKTA